MENFRILPFICDASGRPPTASLLSIFYSETLQIEQSSYYGAIKTRKGDRKALKLSQKMVMCQIIQPSMEHTLEMQ